MACTVRVQLPGDPGEAAYTKLHGTMAQKGFIRTITSDQGTTYDLPHAEYNYEGAAERPSVLQYAKDAAASAGYASAKILVTESNGRTWANLDKH